MSQAHDSINAVGEVINEQAKGFRAFGLLIAELGFSMVMPWLRSSLGERYFSPFMIAVMTVFTFIIANMMKVNPTYIGWYVGLLVALSIYHLFVIPFDQPFRLGGLFYEFSRQIIINDFA